MPWSGWRPVRRDAASLHAAHSGDAGARGHPRLQLTGSADRKNAAAIAIWKRGSRAAHRCTWNCVSRTMTARDSVISLREGGSFRIEALQASTGRIVDLGVDRQGHVYQRQSIQESDGRSLDRREPSSF